MKVRVANKFDLPIVLDMLRNFRNHTPIDIMRECNNEEYINKLFHHVILGGGVALIAEDKGVAGMIIGVKDQNVWDPEIKVLRELVYWVEPEYRGTTAGYKLLLKYNKLAQELVDTQKINMYTMTKMVNSPDLDFTRFGYKKTEEVWVAGV
jgi:N-acetylglutamate synthase-like GNAT family acetyltransferase